VARQRHGAKSAIVEEAIRVQLEQPQHPGIEEGMAWRLDDLDKTIATVGRDVAILAETLALFVRYFLTITPVLPESEQEAARRLGRERFEVFVPQVGQRLLGTFASYRKSSRPSPYTNRTSRHRFRWRAAKWPQQSQAMVIWLPRSQTLAPKGARDQQCNSWEEQRWREPQPQRTKSMSEQNERSLEERRSTSGIE
jgi:hypothetical protein